MKKVPSGNGHFNETMTVAELRQKLSEFADDLPVCGTWEGIVVTITPDVFFVQKVGATDKTDGYDCLLLDVDND